MPSSKATRYEMDSAIISKDDMNKLYELNNDKVLRIVDEYIQLCKPSKVTVITDSPKDIEYIRQRALEEQEEMPLKLEGSTIHYDSYEDQARDKENTKTLIPKGEYASPWINTIDRGEGLKEIMSIMDGAMKGKECVVRFFCLGPKNSKFTICALQLTDSLYVAHSEDLLYRAGYEEFKKLNGSEQFYYLVHSAGELIGNPPVTKNIDQRRIYMDLKENRVLTVNNQYAGNSLGLKKLALRLAINQANNEDWLTEHMFIMGVHPEGKNRVSYFCGAYPSACGKTSTAMIPGQTIVGDDIAYLRIWSDGHAHAVNIECGIFGIIKDVNAEDDPIIYEALTTPREMIFSNVLINEGHPYWLGMGIDTPKDGFNHSGNWNEGKKDKNGKEIPLAHPNARYTIRISELSNADPNLNNPEGVPLHGIFYGGRDSDTMVPIIESFNWEHGIFLGASIESETTTATLGKAGVRSANPMANLDFMVVPLSKYLKNHQKLGNALKYPPKVFATNYFLKNEKGKYITGMMDKKVWLLWAEGRAHDDFKAINSPIGFLPLFDDLKHLFKTILNKEYSKEDYVAQFSIRCDKLLEKLNRIEKLFKKEEETPEFFWNLLNDQRARLVSLQSKYRKSTISPFDFY